MTVAISNRFPIYNSGISSGSKDGVFISNYYQPSDAWHNGANPVQLYRDAANVLAVADADDFEVTTDIVNDDVVNPSITVTGSTRERGFRVEILKLNNAHRSANDYEVIHWWISSTDMGAPSIGGGGTKTWTMKTGSNIPSTPTPASVLQTGWTGTAAAAQYGIWEVKVRTTSNVGTVTNYFMCEVQGIVKSASFTLLTSG